MKKLNIFLLLFAFSFSLSYAQKMQVNLRQGDAGNKVEIWVKPDYGNTTQYVSQYYFPVAFPISAPVTPGDLSVAYNLDGVIASGVSYLVEVNNQFEYNTVGNVKYVGIGLTRDYNSASPTSPDTWQQDVEYKVATITFTCQDCANSNLRPQVAFIAVNNETNNKLYAASSTGFNFNIDETVPGSNFYIVDGQSVLNNDGSDAYVGLDEDVLSLELKQFSAKKSDCMNALSWEVAKPEIWDYFIVERSHDGKNFESMLRINAEDYKSQYSVNAQIPEDLSSQYYKLKAFRIDSKVLHSKVLHMNNVCELDNSVLIFPQPAQQKITVQANKWNGVTYRIVNLIGQEISSGELEGSSTVISIDNLPSGNYQIILLGSNDAKSYKIVKM